MPDTMDLDVQYHLTGSGIPVLVVVKLAMTSLAGVPGALRGRVESAIAR
jgi:hypothetical protein